ncbi:MAG: retropepsin-like aspartic protease [Anaerolineae bacterium]|jgi:predicted aspartyl protease
MRLILKDSLPFTNVQLRYHGAEIEIPDVLIDTGSASTILAAHLVAQAGIEPEMSDTLYTIRGVGGTEAVFSRRVDLLQVGPSTVADFEIEVGGMDYGFEINGILGMDYMLQTGMILNLHDLSLEFSERPRDQ